VPAYHCPSVISPAIAVGLEPVFYRIKPDLTIDYEDVLRKADDTMAALVVIHYFGVAPDMAPVRQLQLRGVRLIEDCSHSFLHVDPLGLAGCAESDYRIFSFWKIVPSAVGGGLLRGSGATAQPRPQAPLKARARSFKRSLEESIEHSNIGPLRSAFGALERLRLASRAPSQQSPKLAPTLECGEDYYEADPDLAAGGMPAFAKRVLMSSDLAEIANRRRANFLRYAAPGALPDAMRVMVPQLPSHACPWVFPVVLDDRERYDTKLRAAGVQLHSFGTFLHSALHKTGDERTIADARHLAQRMLCLSIHQDLGTEDIDRAALTVRTELKRLMAPCS
jgi:dTDP-4-amino-4,6-dideoxygalactose transaminase